MVEAWRTTKESVQAVVLPEIQVHLFLIYTGSDMPEYSGILKSVVHGIAELEKQLVKQFPPRL